MGFRYAEEMQQDPVKIRVALPAADPPDNAHERRRQFADFIYGCVYADKDIT